MLGLLFSFHNSVLIFTLSNAPCAVHSAESLSYIRKFAVKLLLHFGSKWKIRPVSKMTTEMGGKYSSYDLTIYKNHSRSLLLRDSKSVFFFFYQNIALVLYRRLQWPTCYVTNLKQKVGSRFNNEVWQYIKKYLMSANLRIKNNKGKKY